MKLTKLPDGTVHVEGTPEEVRALLAPPEDAIGKMLVQYPPFAPACPAPFMGQVWVGTIKPSVGWAHNAGAACAANPAASMFVWPPSNAGAFA